MVGNIYRLGQVKIEFEEIGNLSNKFTISETFKEDDVTLVSEKELFSVEVDQKSGPVEEFIISQNVTFTASIPVNLELLTKLTNTWKEGTSGFSLGGLGSELKKFKVSIVPKGKTATNGSTFVIPVGSVNVVENFAYKMQGLTKATLTIKAVSDENDNVLQTGDYVPA